MERRRDPRGEAGALGDGIAGGRGGGARGGKKSKSRQTAKAPGSKLKSHPHSLWYLRLCKSDDRILPFSFKITPTFGVQTNSIQTGQFDFKSSFRFFFL